MSYIHFGIDISVSCVCGKLLFFVYLNSVYNLNN